VKNEVSDKSKKQKVVDCCTLELWQLGRLDHRRLTRVFLLTVRYQHVAIQGSSEGTIQSLSHAVTVHSHWDRQIGHSTHCTNQSMP